MYLDAQLFATAASYWPLTRVSQTGPRDSVIPHRAATPRGLVPRFHSARLGFASPVTGLAKKNSDA
jgi:hypothetical protein